MNLPTPTTLADVAKFIHCVIVDLGVNFHPDGDFLDYVHSTTGRRRFTPELAEELNAVLAQCFAVCEQHGADLYEMALPVLLAQFSAV